MHGIKGNSVGKEHRYWDRKRRGKVEIGARNGRDSILGMEKKNG
jgi:hypothetical protein